jgi:hypothetical protein
VGKVHLLPAVGNQMANDLRTDREAVRVARMIQGGELLATFNQDEALKHARAELIHSRHPLIKLVSSSIDARADTLRRAFALHLGVDSLVGEALNLSGDFAFAIHTVEIHGVRQAVSLVPIFVTDNRSLSREQSEDLLLCLIRSAGSLDPPPTLEPEVVDLLSEHLENELSAIRASMLEEERVLNRVRHDRLKATKSLALNRRVEEAERRLDMLLRKDAAEFAITMAKRRLEKEQRIRSAELESLTEAEVPRLETELVAVGILVIGE